MGMLIGVLKVSMPLSTAEVEMLKYIIQNTLKLGMWALH